LVGLMHSHYLQIYEALGTNVTNSAIFGNNACNF
jgi:hypothetical protein